MALYNHYQHSLDAKGRVNFPAKLRENLGNRFIITRGLDSDRCLFAYSEENWEALGEDKNPAQRRRPRVQRFCSPMPSTWSRTSRDALSSPASERVCRLKRKMISGIGDHAEIWDKDLWIRSMAYTPT